MNKIVGDKRTFSKHDKTYEIIEILDNPSIELEWTWTDTICPYCKHKLSRTMKHTFYKIEILKDETITDKDLTQTDIVIIGDSHDGRKMMFPIDQYNKIFDLSEKYKNLKKEGN